MTTSLVASVGLDPVALGVEWSTPSISDTDADVDDCLELMLKWLARLAKDSAAFDSEAVLADLPVHDNEAECGPPTLMLQIYTK